MQHSGQDVPRETFIALRARRQAYHIATDILYEEPIDLRTVCCFVCGACSDVPDSQLAEVVCGRCGSPLSLAAHIKPPLARRLEWLPLDLPDHSDERLGAEIKRELDDTAGVTTMWFTVFIAVLIAVALFLLS